MPDTLTQVLSLLEKSPDVNAQAARQILQKAIGKTVFELPCEIEHRVWVIFKKAIHREYVASFQIRGPMQPDFCIMNDGRDDEPEFKAYCHYEDFGKTVFLTEAAAREALEMQNEKK